MKLAKNDCAIVVTKVLNGFILEMYDADSNLLFKAVASDMNVRGYDASALCSTFETCWNELDKILAEQQPKVATSTLMQVAGTADLHMPGTDADTATKFKY